MSEDEEKEKEEVKIIWVDGIPCMELPEGSIKKKRQNNSVNHPFTFGYMQEQKKREFMPDILSDLEKHFANLNTPFFPIKWKIFKITEKGEIKELKDEDKEDDNAK